MKPSRSQHRFSRPRRVEDHGLHLVEERLGIHEEVQILALEDRQHVLLAVDRGLEERPFEVERVPHDDVVGPRVPRVNPVIQAPRGHDFPFSRPDGLDIEEEVVALVDEAAEDETMVVLGPLVPFLADPAAPAARARLEKARGGHVAVKDQGHEPVGEPWQHLLPPQISVEVDERSSEFSRIDQASHAPEGVGARERPAIEDLPPDPIRACLLQ